MEKIWVQTLTPKWQDDYGVKKKKSWRSQIYINGTVVWVGRTPTSISHSLMILSFLTFSIECACFCIVTICWADLESLKRQQEKSKCRLHRLLSFKESIETNVSETSSDSLKCARKQKKHTLSFVKLEVNPITPTNWNIFQLCASALPE